jgi:hypothetical protein
MTKSLISLAALACLTLCGVAISDRSVDRIPKDREVLDIGSRLEPLVDLFISNELRGKIGITLHPPQLQNVAIVHDQPWEGSGTYHTVFKDDAIYRMYYSVPRRGLVCYAESVDGITFNKPHLNLIEFDGSKANNIVWKGEPIGHNLTPFKDPNPECPPEYRYKALGGIDTSGLFALVSPDGIQWRKLTDGPVLTDGHFDSQNVAFWDDQRGLYRAYYRDWHRQSPARRLRGILTDRIYRGIKTATSTDFINWTPGHWLDYTNTPDGDALLENVHLYTNAIRPYHRAPHLYVGFPVRYMERDFGPSSNQLPNAEAHERRMRRIERGNAQTEALLITSRDGATFDFRSEAFLRPGLQRNNWIYGNNYVAWHLVETVGEAPYGQTELSLYVTENVNLGADTPGQLRRYTLRLDGFASLNAPLAGGEMVTRRVRFEGDRLMLNYSTSAAGSLRVELQDADGKPLPGFTLSECDEIYGDQIERTVSWNHRQDVGDLQGQILRLRFVLRDADLYSFAFR